VSGQLDALPPGKETPLPYG